MLYSTLHPALRLYSNVLASVGGVRHSGSGGQLLSNVPADLPGKPHPRELRKRLLGILILLLCMAMPPLTMYLLLSSEEVAEMIAKTERK